MACSMSFVLSRCSRFELRMRIVDEEESSVMTEKCCIARSPCFCCTRATNLVPAAGRGGVYVSRGEKAGVGAHDVQEKAIGEKEREREAAGKRGQRERACVLQHVLLDGQGM